MATFSLSSAPARWELAAEAIAVKIRWFGLLLGYLVVNMDGSDGPYRPVLNAILTLGAGYAILDTYNSYRGRVFLGSYPLIISLMEGLFIGLLCYFKGGLEGPFRYYYFLSLICCAIRHPARITYLTCAIHCTSVGLLSLALGPEQPPLLALVQMVVALGWVTWAGTSLALLLKRVGEHLGRLNHALQDNQALLEERIAERTRELHEAQAHLLHQEKMAAFGLLAAGIAHEVGNPLTSISSIVQMLQKRDCDEYTAEKLSLVNGQLHRIQTTLRELVNFSRPASDLRTRVSLCDIVNEALNIAKYYKGTKGRSLVNHVSPELPPIEGFRDQLVQICLNLILNSIDATHKGGRIELDAGPHPDGLQLIVRDNGCGVLPEHRPRLFQPYFTTKKHGTGLGLFVTHKLVTDHGGRMEYESRPGEGTLFRVIVPAIAAAQES